MSQKVVGALRPCDVAREVIRELGMKLYEAAQLLGYSRSALSRFLNGRARLSKRMAAAFSEAFNVDLEAVARSKWRAAALYAMVYIHRFSVVARRKGKAARLWCSRNRFGPGVVSNLVSGILLLLGQIGLALLGVPTMVVVVVA